MTKNHAPPRLSTIGSTDIGGFLCGFSVLRFKFVRLSVSLCHAVSHCFIFSSLRATWLTTLLCQVVPNNFVFFSHKITGLSALLCRGVSRLFYRSSLRATRATINASAKHAPRAPARICVHTDVCAYRRVCVHGRGRVTRHVIPPRHIRYSAFCTPCTTQRTRHTTPIIFTLFFRKK
jgi:hypothetical protein